MEKRFNAREVAEMLKMTPQGVRKKLNAGHFPHAQLCECERTVLIPNSDVKKNMKK